MYLAKVGKPHSLDPVGPSAYTAAYRYPAATGLLHSTPSRSSDLSHYGFRPWQVNCNRNRQSS